VVDPNPVPEPARTSPVRTCIGCRQKATATELIRIVVSDPGPPVTVVPDVRRSAPGRGAHLHPTLQCLELAVRRKAFGRALRVTAAVDHSQVAAHVVSTREHLQSNTALPPPGGDERRRSGAHAHEPSMKSSK